MNNCKDWIAIESLVRMRGLVDPAKWYDAVEVVAILEVGPRVVSAACVSGDLPSRVCGNLRRRIRGRDLLAWLREKAKFAPRPKAA